MAGFKRSRIYGDDEVADLVSTALAIVADLDPPEDLRLQTFQVVVGLVAATTLEQTPSGIIPPTMHIPGGP